MKYVGVDIGGTNLKAGLVDESGTLLATQKMKVVFQPCLYNIRKRIAI